MAQWVLYDSFREYIGDGTIDLDDDEFQVELVSSGYTPIALTHTHRSDIEAHVIEGYETTLTSVAWTRDEDIVDWAADDVLIEVVGTPIQPRWAVLLNTTASGSPLVGYLTLGADMTVGDGQRLRINLSAGVLG